MANGWQAFIRTVWLSRISTLQTNQGTIVNPGVNYRQELDLFTGLPGSTIVSLSINYTAEVGEPRENQGEFKSSLGQP
ncbi:hypothetical protein [Leptolyngbya sp. 'hensonii']|uniref:hypothetical protein n=1 Tax=Leptolyngbya sp. 'hensonii' TaxID=1922337 RepID=UPI000A61EE8F|nr:hypothetical protein [Leptolyngbya sp. 'hensonii']